MSPKVIHTTQGVLVDSGIEGAPLLTFSDAHSIYHVFDTNPGFADQLVEELSLGIKAVFAEYIDCLENGKTGPEFSPEKLTAYVFSTQRFSVLINKGYQSYLQAIEHARNQS